MTVTTLKTIANDTFFLNLVVAGYFKVSRSGIVTNVKTGYSAWSVNSEYRKVHYLSKSILLHRLVYVYFHGLIPIGMCVNHKDGNKLNCRIQNLELVTESGNHVHAIVTGLKRKSTAKSRLASSITHTGGNNVHAKFSDRSVRLLRVKFARGDVDITSIENKYGASRRTCVNMLTGITYPYVEMPAKLGRIAALTAKAKRGRKSSVSEVLQRALKLKRSGYSVPYIAEKLSVSKWALYRVL